MKPFGMPSAKGKPKGGAPDGLALDRAPSFRNRAIAFGEPRPSGSVFSPDTGPEVPVSAGCATTQIVTPGPSSFGVQRSTLAFAIDMRTSNAER
jgi:hypothetical protein